jgi:hypothetical protein
MKKSKNREKKTALGRDDPEQSKLFVKKAKEIGADDDRSAADALIGHLAKLPPQPKQKPRTK